MSEISTTASKLLVATKITAARDRIAKDFHQHYALADKGHREDHFRAVEDCANCINEKLELELNPYLLMLGAWFHDLFAWSRKNHHELIHEWINTTDYPIVVALPITDKIRLATACLEHRASWKHTHSNLLSEVLSAADRGYPTTDMEEKLQRPIEYRLKQGATLEEAREGAILHLKEKYGKGGYARYNRVWMECFGDELAAMHDAIAAL
jgi:hypothetical protein